MKAFGLFVIAVCFVGGFTNAQDVKEQHGTPDQTAAIHDAQKTELEVRIENIKKELADLDRDALPDDHWAKEWAGTYFVGDGLGANITLIVAPESGIAYTWYGCMGLYYYSYGTISEVVPDGLIVDLEVEEIRRKPFMDSRLYFVKWGHERFLIPEHEMLSFVNDYNKGGRMRSSMGFSPRKDGTASMFGHNLDSAGIPELPARWAKLLRTDPIELTVQTVTSMPKEHVVDSVWKHSLEIEFSGGSEVGVYDSMEFDLDEGFVTIVEVKPDSCRGVFRAFNDKNHEFAPIELGRIVSLP